jgi:energy-converting hydrogenase B subunit D
MTLVLGVLFLLVAATGTTVVLQRDPLHQVIVLGFFGISMAVLFVALQAPDVALSQLTVGTVAVPAMVLITLVKIRKTDR